jgi:hypothetical protein
MEKRGFSLARRRLCYSRKVNDIYHIIMLGFTRGNEKFFIYTFAWVPELAPQPYDWDSFPDGVTIVTGGTLADSGPISRAAGVRYWVAGSQAECLTGLSEALSIIDRAAIPWLDRIATRQDMVAYINKDSESDRFGNRTAEKVLGNKVLHKADLPPPVGA